MTEPMDNSCKNRRIARNAVALYIRMFLLMAISLYTSRVILQVLGVEDFGIFGVIAGFVALFGVLSRSLSSAASRFLNFELGKCDGGNAEKLRGVFSTIFVIHLLMAVLIVVLGEPIGYWFVHHQMNVPAGRLTATMWVFHFSVINFCINLLIVPFNAAIIAHEKMSVFAYISLFEGIAKLLMCFLVIHSPFDHLIYYVGLTVVVQLIIVVVYYLYCKWQFSECTLFAKNDRQTIRDITSFAGWNIIGSSSAILVNQGCNILLNLYGGGLVVNAARTISNQVQHAVHGFIENFITAVKPQITQSYAAGNLNYMMMLVLTGARLSYYLMLFVCLPLLLNADFILHAWLTEVPNYSVEFVQWTLAYILVESLSGTLITAQLATGIIRNYQLLVGGLQLLNLPVGYLMLILGCSPLSIYYAALAFAVICLVARIYMLSSTMKFSARAFIIQVLGRVAVTTIVASFPLILYTRFHPTDCWTDALQNVILCILINALVIYVVGCTQRERSTIRMYLRKIIHQ